MSDTHHEKILKTASNSNKDGFNSSKFISSWDDEPSLYFGWELDKFKTIGDVTEKFKFASSEYKEKSESFVNPILSLLVSDSTDKVLMIEDTLKSDQNQLKTKLQK